MKHEHYEVTYEETSTGWSAYVPDLPGCVATAKTRRGIERVIKSAIALHLDGLREEGYVVPTPATGIVAQLRKARLDSGMSQAEIARRMGVAQSRISEIEAGRVNPSADRIEAYARALGLQLLLGQAS